MANNPTFQIPCLVSESQRLLIAANKAKAALHEWHCSGSVWVHDDKIEWSIRPISQNEPIKFDTLEALEAWVDSLSLGGSREILHRRFKL